MSNFHSKLEPTATKKLLALDGGGIRGLISVEVLAEIEALLRSELDAGPDFVLADYFDYVAGNSTGAIIATCVALGMPVAKIRKFYKDYGEEMFDRSYLNSLRYKYEDDRFAAKLREIIGKETTLGSEDLKTLLMLVMQNASTDSPWFLSNNPNAKYNDRNRDDCNLDIPLWKLVRASTAAPVYFPPEFVKLGTRDFVFVDGGVTSYNNPALQLFLMATADRYKLGWPTGAEKMLLVSVGTGYAPNEQHDVPRRGPLILDSIKHTIGAFGNSASSQQDLMCRMLGHCLVGDPIDRELGSLIEARGLGGPNLFTYLRYDINISQASLNDEGLAHIRQQDIASLDSIEHMNQLSEVGRRLAARVAREHFGGFTV